MKIGIVTLPLLDNYGGILQNFALQQVLKRLDHIPVTIDFIPTRRPWHLYLLSLCKTLVFFFLPGKRRPFHSYPPVPFRNAVMQLFVDKHITVTHQVSRYSPQLVETYAFDAVITGSDQIWRSSYNRFIRDMYLRFVSQKNVKKIAYAASFGVDYWEYTSFQTHICMRYAKQLTAVSVREFSGISLCKNYLDIDAIEVLDPTLLLDKEDYEKVCESVSRKQMPFLAAYVLDMNMEKELFIKRIAAEHKLKIEVFGVNDNVQFCVEEWIAMFRDADFVVTDSFHGTVFSIIFNVPFISIGNEQRGLGRFDSLLNKFYLQDRLLTCFNDFSAYTLPVCWEKVNEIRQQWKQRSIRFLQGGLNISVDHLN